MKIATPGRQIFQRGGAGAVSRLLQTVFVAEMIHPSTCLWLVSPWISNIEVIDNRTDGFRHLEPQWPLGSVRLSDVLAALVARGTEVHIATRPARPWLTTNDTGRHNDRFLDELRHRIAADAALHIHREEEKHLHTKGLLGDRFFLSGSMNFTHNGIVVNDEQVRFTTDPSEVAQARIEFRERWGGAT